MVTKEDAQRATLAQAEAKAQLEALQIVINDMRKTFEEELKPYLQHVKKLEAEIANTDKVLLDEILADIEAGNSTEADYPFVSFRHDNEIVYDEKKALKKAEELGAYLRVSVALDKVAFKKAMQDGSSGIDPADVGFEVAPRLSAKFKDLF